MYLKGVTLTLFYLLMAPVISSLISIALAFISPFLSLLSFLLILVLVFIIRMKRIRKDKFEAIDLTDEERDFVENIRKSIYGEWIISLKPSLFCLWVVSSLKFRINILWLILIKFLLFFLFALGLSYFLNLSSDMWKFWLIMFFYLFKEIRLFNAW